MDFLKSASRDRVYAVGDLVMVKGWQPVEQRRAVVTDVVAAPMIGIRMTTGGAEHAIAAFALVPYDGS